jgi:processive 1,2-diacylglycerol beta-glucosyltransferase
MVGRIAIVSASIGAGHDGAARELARRLQADGFTVSRCDFLDVLPGRLGPTVRSAYRRQLAVAPRSWDWLLALLGTRLATGLVAWLSTMAGRPLLRAVGTDVDLVVSTYPLATQVLARLRRRGRLTAPLVSYLTDPSVHRLCVARGTDRYLAMHPVTADAAHRLSARGVMVTAPAVAPEFRPATDAAERTASRQRFNLPTDRPLALLLSGSWGVGEVEDTAREVAATGIAVPIVACGQNTALRERLAEHDIGVPLGWVDDMSTLMRACNVVVQNAGGLGSLEALATGLPVLTYRCLAGHGRTNAAALDSAGLVPWVRKPEALPTALSDALRGRQLPDSTPDQATGPDPAVPITELAAAGSATEPAAALIGGRPSRPRWTRLAAASVALATLLWLGTEGTSLAVAHGWQAATPPGVRHNTVFLVVGPAPGRPLDPDTVRRMLAANAAVAVSSGLAQRQPGDVRNLAGAGVVLVNAGNGAPYETGVIGGRSAIASAARGIARLTGHAPRLLLSNGDLDAIDLAMVALQRERFVVPHTVVPCGAPPPRLPAEGVVLLQMPATGSCDLGLTLDRVNRQADAQSLVPTPLTKLAT